MNRAVRWYLVALVALFLGWLPKIQATTVPWSRDNDFAHSYLTALMVSEGVSPYDKDLVPLYRQYDFSPTRAVAKAGNPPPLAALMSPITRLSPDSAYVVWVVVQLVSLAGGVLLLIAALKIRVSSMGKLGLILGSIAPLSTFALIRYGQGQAIIFFFLSLAVWCARRPSWWLSPFLLGLSSSFKLFTAPLVFVALRYWSVRGVALFAAGFAALWIPFLVVCGAQGLKDFLFSTLPYVQSLSLSFDANISVSGAFSYTMQALGVNPFASTLALQGVCLVLLAVLVFLEYRRSRACREYSVSVAYVVALCVIFSPTAWPHYIPLLTPLFLCLVREAQRSQDPEREMLWVVGMYLCVGSALGFQRSGDIITQVVSAWWAPVWISVASWRLLVLSRATSADERLPCSAQKSS